MIGHFSMKIFPDLFVYQNQNTIEDLALGKKLEMDEIIDKFQDILVQTPSQ